MTRTVFSALGFVILITNQLAAADDTYCEQLNKVLAGSAEKFSALKGETKKSEVDMWIAKESIPGGQECVVIGSEPPSYMCTLYAGDKDESARIKYEDQVQWIGKCLGDAWKGKEKADAMRKEHTFSRGGSDATVRVRSEIGMENAYTVELWIDAPAS